MLQITNVAISEAAWVVLDARLLEFAARSDVLTLVYTSRFVEADGTTVPGFRPGYCLYSLRIENLSLGCGVVTLPGRRSLYLMRRSGWDETTRYVIDLIDERLGLFSIDPLG